MATKTIKITKGTEYKFKIEEAHEFADSLMSDVYNDAAGCVLDIINTPKDEGKSDQDYYNNIIAFVGDRGTGKSSAMLSFAQSLLVNGLPDTYKEEKGNQQNIVYSDSMSKLKSKLSNYNVETLKVIDPSLLEKNDSILEIIVSSLFLKFEENLKDEKNKENKQNFDSRKKLLEKFQGVQDVLKTIQTRDEKKSELYNGHTIECLGKLSASTNLKNSFMELIAEYLKFMTGNDKNEQNYLLIKVDDLDLNFKYAYNMIEQIRKYLIIPQVIVLMGAKLDQLEDIVEQNFIMEFKEKLGCEVIEYQTLHEKPKEMTTRYLEKLIPENRRLNMPNLNIYRTDLKIDIDGDVKKLDLEDDVLKEIFDKTGLIFIKNNYELHQIIPRNLRELVGFLVMLYSELKNIKTESKRFDRFEEYFTYHWIRNNIDSNNQKFIENLLKLDIRQWNKFVATNIGYIYKKSNISGNSDQTFNYIVDGNNNSFNISLGDILYVLNCLDKLSSDKQYSNFVFAIKTIYSVILTKSLFFQKNHENVLFLINGSVYNPQETRLIDTNKNFKHYSKINYQPIIELIKKNDNFYTKNRAIEGEIDYKEIKFTNWISMFIPYLYKVDEEYLVNRGIDRKEKLPYYNRSNKRLNNAIFDFLAVCFMTLDIRNTVNRYFCDVEELSLEEFNEKISKYPVIGKTLNDWKEKYHVLLPIYSIEAFEKIINEYIYKYSDVKDVMDDKLFNYLCYFIEKLELTIKKLNISDNFLSAFQECPIIKHFNDNKKIINFKDLINNLKVETVKNVANIELLDITKEFYLALNKFVQDGKYGAKDISSIKIKITKYCKIIESEQTLTSTHKIVFDIRQSLNQKQIYANKELFRGKIIDVMKHLLEILRNNNINVPNPPTNGSIMFIADMIPEKDETPKQSIDKINVYPKSIETIKTTDPRRYILNLTIVYRKPVRKAICLKHIDNILNLFSQIKKDWNRSHLILVDEITKINGRLLSKEQAKEFYEKLKEAVNNA